MPKAAKVASRRGAKRKPTARPKARPKARPRTGKKIVAPPSGVTVAIDGPAGAGKSTVAKRVAEALAYTLVDTGAIYRAVALVAREQGRRFDDDAALATIVENLDIHFAFADGKNHVLLGGRDVSADIRTPEISMGASAVSARPVVRKGLLDLQRRLAGVGGAVLEGRDIGTVVFPQAQVKVFLFSAPEERARRRYEERRQKGEEPDFEQVLAEVNQRDRQDAARDVAPMRPAEDAIQLDSTRLDIDGVVGRVLEAVRDAGRDLRPRARVRAARS